MKHLIEKYLFLHAIMEITETFIDADKHGITEEQLNTMDKHLDKYIENIDLDVLEQEVVELLKLFPKENE